MVSPAEAAAIAAPIVVYGAPVAHTRRSCGTGASGGGGASGDLASTEPPPPSGRAASTKTSSSSSSSSSPAGGGDTPPEQAAARESDASRTQAATVRMLGRLMREPCHHPGR